MLGHWCSGVEHSFEEATYKGVLPHSASVQFSMSHIDMPERIVLIVQYCLETVRKRIRGCNSKEQKADQSSTQHTSNPIVTMQLSKLNMLTLTMISRAQRTLLLKG